MPDITTKPNKDFHDKVIIIITIYSGSDILEVIFYCMKIDKISGMQVFII